MFGSAGIGPPFPGAYRQGCISRVEPPVQNLHPQKSFYNALRGGVDFNPLITPLTLLIMSKKNDRKETFRQKITYSNLKDFIIFFRKTRFM